ncbi:MAG: thiamine diphosphokinase [Clostridia bacterium]|nr:thiamine diphosphokinase [Clostridia bacterium]
MKYALVLNAPELDIEVKEKLIIAADGGYRLVDDRAVQAVIGDFDTLGYIPDFVTTISHPTDKDQTDGEICLDYLSSIGATDVTIYGALGGKIDHVLGNLNLLAYAKKVGLNAVAVSASTEVYFVDGPLLKECEVGSTLSIIPFGGEVSFEHSFGLKYPLDGIKIAPYSSLGLSNEVTVGKVEIKVENGECLVIIRKK